MELSNAQKRLIREICRIQHDSLTNLLATTELGTSEWGEKWETVLENLTLSRKEFDEEVINTIRAYRDIDDDPNTLFQNLDEFDFRVFEYLLSRLDDQLREFYPKAYENLLVKMEIWKSVIISKS